MDNKSLLDWIENPERDYEDGLQMLKRLLPLQSPIVRSLTMKPNLEKLIYELQKRVDQTIEKVPPPKFGPKPLAEKAKILIKSGVDLKEVDFYQLSDMERAQVKRGQLANERNQLANQLADLTTPEQRRIVRGRMRDLQAEIESQSKLIFRLDRGEDKPDKPADIKRKKVVDDPQYKEIRAEINNIRAKISMRKKKIRAVSIRDISEAERKSQIKVLQNEIEEYQPQLTELEAQIHKLRYANGETEKA